MVCGGLAYVAFPPGRGWVGILVGLGAAFVVEFLAEGRRAEAWRAYIGGLARLAANPDNPDLRREALVLGLRYSEASRDLSGRGGYPEEAVRRDIAAITAQPDQVDPA